MTWQPRGQPPTRPGEGEIKESVSESVVFDFVFKRSERDQLESEESPEFFSSFSAGTWLPSRLISWHVLLVMLNRHFIEDAASVKLNQP